MFETVVRFFQEGGMFMYPILVVLIIGLAIAIERYVYLSYATKTNRAAFEKGIMPSLVKGDYKTAYKFANDSGTAIAAMIASGLRRLLNSGSREEVEYAMEEGLMETLPRLEKRTQYLATLDTHSIFLDTSHHVEVSSSPYITKICRLQNDYFTGAIRDKLYWGIDKRNSHA